MAYAAREESLRLLTGKQVPAAHLRLSRRVRHLPVAVDRDGDVAATMFLRRGVSGMPLFDVHSLEQDGIGWRLLGGSGSGAEDVLSAPRPHLSDGGPLAVSLGGGGTARGAARRMPWGEKWVRWAEVRLAADVTALRVEDRELVVAPHGLALVVWGSRRRPPIAAHDEHGQELGLLALRER